MAPIGFDVKGQKANVTESVGSNLRSNLEVKGQICVSVISMLFLSGLQIICINVYHRKVMYRAHNLTLTFTLSLKVTLKSEKSFSNGQFRYVRPEFKFFIITF